MAFQQWVRYTKTIGFLQSVGKKKDENLIRWWNNNVCAAKVEQKGMTMSIQ